MSHAMSDDQVAEELKKMTAFIRQEALEKAREIQIKADEEFAIEKSKLVRQETASIDSAYAKKHKQASMSQQVTRSTLANKTRLKVLGRGQELLDDLFEKVRNELSSASKDASKYEEMCRGLVLEGLYALNENKVALRARQQDFKTVKSAAESAKQEYTENIGGKVEIILDEKNPLPESSAGGVFIIGGSGKIDINNTLEERLKLSETDALPLVRRTLFGQNENRKFRD
ncbi:V-ATPase V1 sector subunit E [Bacidia gigantensis]|uniref:V-ATPase V1 sector subunit E n=1 Tax=Bacidia gigantensis TaxID=2732470 RepID=UPI001D0571EC|nr:V-ATPase V1 sector subunit E [Bacidia gigantensis]KAG8528729.1 V-ATPase V1 sector subunit E [Bacidia gigantensis]